MIKYFFMSILLSLLSMSYLYAQNSKEEIYNYDVIINVQTDRSLLIEENIEVYANNEEINHGIYRDIPLLKKMDWGLNHKYKMSVLDVRKNGKKENYHIKNESQYKRIYIGNSDLTLTPGKYLYTIKYRIEGALDFISNNTVLYWNIIGTQWSFPIRHATLLLSIPDGTGKYFISQETWSGVQGSTDSRTLFSQTNKGLFFQLDRSLSPGEAWTIKINWKNGVVTIPSKKDKIKKIVLDNSGLFIILAGILLILGYYLITWYMLGIDPKKGSIMTYYEAPEGLSPASMRYIQNMGYDNKIFSAIIISLAVKGHILIKEKKDIYTLSKVDTSAQKLSQEETLVFNELFEDAEEITVDNKQYLIFQEAIRISKNSLKKSYMTTYFITNRKIFIIGLILSVITLITGFLSGGSGFIMVFMMFWLSLWNVGIFFLLKTVVTSWKKAVTSRRKKGINTFTALFMTFFSLFFIGSDVMAFWFIMKNIPSALFLVIGAAIAVFLNYIFFRLLKAPTLTGRKIMDKIEGFKRFLDVTEKEKIEYFNPPEKSVVTFEQFLPYALAFDMEENWAGYFHDVLLIAEGGQPYSPLWYSGTALSTMSYTEFTNSLGSSFSSALSSASVSPSSGGSGGSSGGGGGGGGGGGW